MSTRFTVRSSRCAVLEVAHDSSSFGLTRDPNQRHGFGLRAAPRYRIIQPFSPDERWDFAPRTTAEDVPDAWTPTTELERRIEAWAADCGATRGLSVLTALPRGRYALVKTVRRPLAPDRVLMGNELVVRPPHVLVLRQEEPWYVGIVGAKRGEPPALDQPLVGVVVLNYVGTFGWQGLVLFTPAAHASAETTAGKDLLIVIPLSGELVLDNLAGFDPEWERRSLDRWQRHQAPGLESWLVGPA